jgi:hypothetical protein
LSVIGIIDETDTYRIEIGYTEDVGVLEMASLGVWLPAGFGYLQVTATEGIDMGTATHYEKSERGGLAEEWTFNPTIKLNEVYATSGSGFLPGSGFPITRSVTIRFMPGGNPKGIFAWIRTGTATDAYLANKFAWDDSYSVYKVISTAINETTGAKTSVTAFAAKGLTNKRWVTSYGDYRAIGNSLMTTNTSGSHIRDYLWSETSSSINKVTPQPPGYVYDAYDIPGDATLQSAYLYWAGWRNNQDGSDQDGDGNNNLADEKASFKFYDSKYGTSPVVNTTVNAARYQTQVNGSNGWSYACFIDITKNIQDVKSHIDAGSAGDTYKFTVGGVYAVAGTSEWAFAGWSLILIYESPSEKAHQLYVWDRNFYYSGQISSCNNSNPTLDFLIKGFKAPADHNGDKLTFFTGEGDRWYGDHQWNHCVYDEDFVKFNGTYLGVDSLDPNIMNTRTNIMDGRSSSMGGATIEGVDIDTFNVTSYINGGDTQAEIIFGTGIDIWNLVYVVMSFRTDLVPNNDNDYSVGILAYSYELK